MLLDGVVEFGVLFGEGLFGDGGEEFFKFHAGEFDSCIGQGALGIIVGVGLGFSLGFFGFADFEEFFGDAYFGHELGDFGTGTLHEAGGLFDVVNLFGGKAGLAIGEEFLFDVRAFGPVPELFFFFIGGVGLGEGQPIALDLEEVVGEGGAFEAGDVVGEMAKGGEFAVGVGFGIDVTSHGDVLELGPEEEFGSDGGF